MLAREILAALVFQCQGDFLRFCKLRPFQTNIDRPAIIAPRRQLERATL